MIHSAKASSKSSALFYREDLVVLLMWKKKGEGVSGRIQPELGGYRDPVCRNGDPVYREEPQRNRKLLLKSDLNPFGLL